MKYRLWFVKKGVLRFISHLDVNRTMMRALRSAELPMTYSQGFNPRPLLTFALPLSLGIESDCESMDIQTESEIDCEKVVEKLNRFLPPELHMISCAPPVNDPKIITEATYRIVFTYPGVKVKFKQFWNADKVIVIKKTKSGTKEIDLKLLVKIGKITGDSEKCEFEAILPTGVAENINPTLLTDAFCEQCATEADVSITRIEVRMKNGEKFV
ncbi:MAG TPA: TIGR03936 family radical SAM-associated protein [Oscillospiraceae bacterium]|nr:TIGR03936 family radical SAM-associated protein [Oscillospiraceae bacterium]HPS33857.1 TIGR03936 family radical SAM-associated protein [Oscillospiraceae bacterium]